VERESSSENIFFSASEIDRNCNENSSRSIVRRLLRDFYRVAAARLSNFRPAATGCKFKRS
jgi:hypothetical protein